MKCWSSLTTQLGDPGPGGGEFLDEVGLEVYGAFADSNPRVEDFAVEGFLDEVVGTGFEEALFPVAGGDHDDVKWGDVHFTDLAGEIEATQLGHHPIEK